MARNERYPGTVGRGRRPGRLPLLIVVALVAQLLGTGWAGAVPEDGDGDPRVTVAGAMAVQERFTDSLLEQPGVVGTGLAVGADGEPVIAVLVETASPIHFWKAALPSPALTKSWTVLPHSLCSKSGLDSPISAANPRFSA